MSSNESPSPETFEPDVFPAAKAQEQLYFVQQVIGDSPAYHVPVVFALTGRLDPAALERAVRRVALRHEALRTHFTLGDDGLQQVVTDRPADWRIVDCASEDELGSRLRSETDRPFDLESPPLFRAALLRRDERTALLVLTMHHIVCDGWSLGIVVDELFRHYDAFAAGRDLVLPEPEFQYGDYADWQRAWLGSPAAEKHLDFWSRTLGGELPVLELPGDRPAGTPAPGHGGGGGLLSFPLEPELLDGLHALATAARSTLFTVMLAAYQVLLGRYTGVEDVIVGSPVANRSRIEFERTVGFFVNMVAIRTDLGPAESGAGEPGTGEPGAGEPGPTGPSFRELLTRVRTAALQAQDHHELPFESVVQLVNPRRDPGHDPVFQALFMLDDTTTEPPAAEGLEIVPVPVHSDTAKFQLSLQVNEHDDRPGFELEYRTDRFTPEWAQRFAGHYARLLRLVVEQPDRPLDALFELPAAERAPDRAPDGVAGRAAEDGRDDGWDDEDDTPYVAPRDEDERILAEVWQEALGRGDIGIDHNYFEVGGDSILSIQILSRARRHGLRFELRDLLVAQTIRELTPLVTRTAPEAEAALEPFDLLTAADRARLPDGLADAYPLTSLQAGMLYHSELDAVHRAYHDVAGYHLRGPYSPPAWRSAVAALLERHELLRTSFALRDLGEPVQLVHHQVAEPPVTFEDLSAVPADEQPEALRRHYAWEREHPFDWERPPLIRFHVQRRSADTFQLWVVEHHAILDGWSGRQLLTELLELYLQALGRSTRELAPPPLARFRSLVALEREAVADPGQRAFWRERLDGMTALRLPRTAPAAGVPDLVMTEYELPGQLSADLLRTAAELGVPVRIALLAAHLRVLALLGGTDDVVSGAVYNGRIAEEDGERVVGLFLNTLPVRARIDDGTTWASLVADVAATDLALQPHRRLPLATIQQDAGGGPLFESFFNYTHFHAPDEGTAGELEILDEFGVVPTSFPFGVEFMRDARTGRIGLGLRYDAAQFAAEEIDRWAGYHLTALRSLAAEPAAGIGRTELPAPAELAQLDRWNDTATTYHRPHLLHVLVEEQARLTPDRIAVAFEGGTLSYRELDRRADALARRLVERGVEPGDRVGVCLERSTELVVSLLAVLKAGGAYVPIDPEHPVARIATMVTEAAPALVLTTTALAERVEPSGAAVEAVDTGNAGTGAPGTGLPDAGLPVGGPRVAVDPDAPAYLIFTSGSTGVPKGVVVSHRAICNRLLWMQEEFGLTEADRVLQKTPYTFDVSVWEFFWPLVQGARLVVAAPGAHREPEELAQLIREHSVTTVHFVPSMLRVFLDHADPADCASLRLVVCSGEALPADLRDAHHERLDAELVNLYGPTEAAVDVTCWRCRPGDGATVPIGHPIANIRIHLLDARMNRVPVGVTGELHIGGVGLADGYHGRPDLTAERFVEHTWPDGTAERLYRTGDLARRRPDGAIDYLGRADQQVKVRGMRIELGEIEAALTRHPDVREAAVVLRGHRLAAYVAAPESVTGDALAAYLGDTLPEYMLPSVWTRLERLPLASNGKVDRKLLPEPGPAALAGERTPAPPVTDVQRRLVRVWEETLGVSPIGIHDSFFALGGHSLVALNLAMRIRREFGRKLPVAELLAHNTVARLAPLVTARESGDEDPARLLPIRRAGEGEPLTLVHPVGGGVFCYLPLASQLRPGRPVYGIVSEGLVSGSVANLSVERIAESYVDLLVAKQPKGPYHLAGWSFGAVLVFEMACRLHRRGAEVGSLSMIDAAYPGQFDESLRDEDLALLVFVDVLRAAGMAVPEHDDAEWAAALAEFPTIHEKLRWLVGRLPTAEDGKATELEQWEAYFKVFTTNLTAHNDYRPGRYPGDVVYIEGLDGGAIGSAGAWRAAVDGRFSAHTIEASHYDILRQPHVRQMARLVDRALDGAAVGAPDGAPGTAPDGTPR
ncbi:amino acid adenylation domain-containing protein [Kitasatospora sp. NPDC059160]|uniref:amino acid adenylation domain-containing protein n=1 Tax=Kitasatospora sp. NPDC059160 TaxID=3346748 RepID=UPI0036A1E4BC